MEDPWAMRLVEDPASPLWYVTVVLAGAPTDVDVLRSRLHRYGAEHSFATSLRYSADRAEVSYWDEGDDLDIIAEGALSLWSNARSIVGLPSWQVVGLEILDQTTLHNRGNRGCAPEMLTPGEITPL